MACTGELMYLNRMARRLWMHGAFWRKWILRVALLSFVGLYGLGLLPHHHPLEAVDDADCSVCHAVSGLASLAGDSGPADSGLASPFMQVLLVLSWVPAAFVVISRSYSLRLSRAPPLFS